MTDVMNIPAQQAAAGIGGYAGGGGGGGSGEKKRGREGDGGAGAGHGRGPKRRVVMKDKCLHCSAEGHKWRYCVHECRHCQSRNHSATAKGVGNGLTCPAKLAQQPNFYDDFTADRLSFQQVTNDANVETSRRNAGTMDRWRAHEKSFADLVDQALDLVDAVRADRDQQLEEIRTLSTRLGHTETLALLHRIRLENQGKDAAGSVTAPAGAATSAPATTQIPAVNNPGVNTHPQGGSGDVRNASHVDDGRGHQHEGFVFRGAAGASGAAPSGLRAQQGGFQQRGRGDGHGYRGGRGHA
ncbi:hypothetical protein LTR53_002114 [Teratosphaeriaceae sp. CCFEE 6253]|nr:hypothetical protein LTR53_002114 [Teratosphaeriaceae sp. CCFEE 6253]